MEMALIPGMMALGESIACHLAYAAAESEANKTNSQSKRVSNGKSHPGIYSNPVIEETQTRPHSGIYCNPGALKHRVLPPVAETRQACYPESQGSEEIHSEPLWSSRTSGSEFDSPCPTARLVLPQQASTEVSRPVFCNDPAQSPCTRSLLMPPAEKLCPSKLGNSFGMSCELDKTTVVAATSTKTVKTSASNPYLLQLPFKNVSPSSASNSTSSTCSDLDSSCTLSTFDFGQSSDQSVCCDTESIQLDSPRGSEVTTRMPCGASPVDEKDATSANMRMPGSNTRLSPKSFCRQAFAECKLDNLDDEMADLTKDLEALRASVATSRKALLA